MHFLELLSKIKCDKPKLLDFRPMTSAANLLGCVENCVATLTQLYWDNGKENGNYYNGFYRAILGLFRGYIGIMANYSLKLGSPWDWNVERAGIPD